MSINGPELRVSASRSFKPGLGSALGIFAESLRQFGQPGDKLNMMSGHRFREVRAKLEPDTAYFGVHARSGSASSADEVPNPDAPDGRWDPYAFMPRFAFDPAEDAFPISPDFDGDASLTNNSPATADAPRGNYVDGVIGGKQPLTGGFAVSRKGGYTVLTYSFYYATNKAGGYHQNDYSTAQVYLKPGKGGKLEPAYLATSWHHGAKLTPWSELKKDPQGRPIVGVYLGSHALEVLDQVPSKGLQLQGDGRAVLNGKPLDQRLGFEAFQKNVAGARYLDPASPASALRLRAMTWGDMALNPFLPETYAEAPPYWKQLLASARTKTLAGLGALKDKAEGVLGGAWREATGLFS